MTYRNFRHYSRALESFGTKSALVWKPFIKIERYNFAEVIHKAKQTAQLLSDKGVGIGDRVMIVAPNCPEWTILFLGAQILGAAVVPVDARSNAEAALDYAKQTSPKLIFKSKYLLPDIDKQANVLSIENLQEYISGCQEYIPKTKLTGKETAVIVFTSGTTAAPKGVVLSQKNILSNIDGVQQAIDINPEWRLLSVLPLSHMFELTGTLAILSRGATIHYLPRITPGAIVKGLNEYRITTILAVPQLLDLFMQRIRQKAEAEGKIDVLNKALGIAKHLPFGFRRKVFGVVHKGLGGHLEVVVTGGAPIAPEIAEAWELMGVKAVQGYGLTETSPILTANRLDERRMDSQGKILHNVRLRIATDGEIQAKGPNVFDGYWQNREATKGSFTADGWFKTGDMGKLKDGWLQIQGRAKFMIVLSSGLKVFPEDIEKLTNKEPAFKHACIVGATSKDGEVVKAIIISDKSDKDVSESIERINSQLQPFQRISDWARWPDEDFPRTRLLKVDRKAVQEWANGKSDNRAVSSNNTSQSKPLIQCIRLSIDEPARAIKQNDKLADIGLDSLRRLNLITLIEEQMGIIVAETDITSNTTVRQLEALIAKAPSSHKANSLPPAWPLNGLVRLFGNILRDSLLRLLLLPWIRQRNYGRENLSDIRGPAIYIFNHVDNLDGPVAYWSLPRDIRNKLAVAQADDFVREHKPVAFMSRLCFAAFNFARSAPFMPSLEYTATLIDQGWNIALFPEGSIARTPRIRPFKSGIGLLAVELGVPIVPVKTEGLFGTLPLHAKWFKKRSNVTVKIGKPIYIPKGTAYDEATKQLQKAMTEL